MIIFQMLTIIRKFSDNINQVCFLGNVDQEILQPKLIRKLAK